MVGRVVSVLGLMAVLVLVSACDAARIGSLAGPLEAIFRAEPSPSLPVEPSPTPEPNAPGDPIDLPSAPGSVLTSFEQEDLGPFQSLEIEYRVDLDVEVVRRHYREALREHGWTVGEVEVDEDGWEFQASKGQREVELEIEREAYGSSVEVTLTDITATGSTPPSDA